MREKLTTWDLLQGRSMKNRVDTLYCPFDRPAISNVTNVVPNPLVAKIVPKGVLFLFITT